MAKKETKKPEAANAGEQQAQGPQLSILTQYVKDLSFESPGALNQRVEIGLHSGRESIKQTQNQTLGYQVLI